MHKYSRRVALPSLFLQKVQNHDVLLVLAISSNVSSASLPALETSLAKISKPSSAAPLEHDHTYFKSADKHKKAAKQSRQEKQSAVKYTCGDKVMLMWKGKSVGVGTAVYAKTYDLMSERK